MSVRIRSRLGARIGFSLLELSVVIGVISLIAGAGMTMAKGALKAADRITTQERLNTIKVAIDSFAKTYGYLPCPADRQYLPSDASFGVERRATPSGVPNTANCDATVGATFVNNSTIVIGMVPVRTIGLPDNYAGDAWGNKFTYTMSANMAGDPTRYAANAGALNIQYWSGTAAYNVSTQRLSYTYTTQTDLGPGVRFTGAAGTTPSAGTIVHINGTGATKVYKGSYSVNASTGTTVDITSLTHDGTDSGTGTLEWQSAGTAATYTVVSHGLDGIGAYPVKAASIPTGKTCAAATALDAVNCDENTSFYDTAYNEGDQASEHFDDYIVWGSNEGARSPVNNGVYTSASSTHNCPTGVCEAWCAACYNSSGGNYPGPASATPTAAPIPAAVPPGAISSAAVLCKKFINTASAQCQAICIWGGISATPSYYKCP